MASTYTPLGVELQATGENAGTWGTKTNTNLQIFEQIVGGFTAQSIAGGAQNTDLAVQDGSTGATLSHRMIEFTGSITGNQVVRIPIDVQTFYYLRNSTSGAYTVQFKYITGSGDSFTFSATDKGDAVIFATGNDGTNPDIYTLPNVSLTGTQTLTNKTLTAPKIGTSILDTSGNELALLTATGSAVNEFTLANAATGNNPTISATGGDTNVGITLTPKGTGEIVIAAGNLNYGSTAVTATGAELNYSDLATLGTSAASKVLTANANNLTTISGAVLNTEDTLTDQATIAWDVIASPVAKVTLGANRTMAAPSGTGPAAGQMISLLVIQDGTGSRTITWNAVYEFPSDTAPTLTTTANLGDIFSFRYNGAKWLLIGQTLALTLS